jgi:hypothetical protein
MFSHLICCPANNKINMQTIYTLFASAILAAIARKYYSITRIKFAIVYHHVVQITNTAIQISEEKTCESTRTRESG